MLTLHESLLLFALHDDRGTVHSRAWIGLDDALRGAIAAEWMLRGALNVDRSGLARWTDRPTGSPLLDGVRSAIRERLRTESFEVDAVLSALETWMPSLRAQVERCLTVRGIVQAGEIDRHQLADTPTLRNRGDEETVMMEHLAAGIAAGPAVSRRMGMLIGLAHTLDLWSVLLSPTERFPAREQGEWAIERDAILQAVHRRVLDRSGFDG